MKNKNQKSRIRAIKSTTLIPDLASYVSEQCARYCEASRRIGLFPFQDYYRGRRVFALFDGDKFLNAYEDLSEAKLMLCELRKDFIGRYTIVKMEAI